MYLRCSRCHESTWIRSLVPGLVGESVACQDCGQQHDLARVSELGETAKEQYDAATTFADGNGVDLPTAYSVLLGLMTLEDARGVDQAKQDKNRREAAALATPDAPPEPELPRPAPRPQTRPQPQPKPKPQRSKPRREAPEETVTVHVEREMSEHRKRLTWGQAFLLAILAALTLGLSGRHAYMTWRDMIDAAKNAEKSTAASEKALENAEQKAIAEAREDTSVVPELQPVVERDDRGRVIRVTGPSPMDVLAAYCEAVSDIHPREPLELTEASPPSPTERYGVFRDFSRLHSNRAIRISKLDGENRWSAGNGTVPVPTREASEQARTIRRASLD